MITQDQFQGCLLGLSLGDALGAPFEGGILERLLWRAIGKTKQGKIRWTDDTQMSVDVIESYLSKGTIDQDDLAVRFAKSYHWSRGYGPGTAKLLKRVRRGDDWYNANRSIYRAGSFGNGAAMRAPIVGLIFANRLTDLIDATCMMGFVTHAHQLGIEGAVLLALVTALAARRQETHEIFAEIAPYCTSELFTSRLKLARTWLESSHDASPKTVSRQLGNGIAAHQSCVTAIYLALRFQNQPFMTLQRFTAMVGGDVDTIGAMAGAIWGASNGLSRLPRESLELLEQQTYLIDLATTLYTFEREKKNSGAKRPES